MGKFKTFITEAQPFEITKEEFLKLIPEKYKKYFDFVKTFDDNFYGNPKFKEGNIYYAKISEANARKIPISSNYQRDGKNYNFTIDKQVFRFIISNKSTRGEKSGVIRFNAGDNTAIGETIQIAGFFCKNIDLKSLENSLSLQDLSNPKGVEKKYLSDKALYEPALLTIIDASRQAYKDISSTTGIKYNNIIHKSINKYYSICKDRKLTDQKVIKNNTADCVLYTGSNFLKNLSNPDNIIDYSDYNIKIKTKDNKVLNNFIQISLKNSGRQGDSSYFNALANKYKYEFYTESFSSFLKVVKDKVKKTYSKLSFEVIDFLKNISKKFISTFTSKKVFENKVKDLFYSDLKESKYFKTLSTKDILLFESKKPIPTEQQLGDRYSNKDEFIKLTNKGLKSLKEIKKKLNSFGDNVIYKIDIDENIAYTSNYKEIRYIYYNVVSLLILKDFILNLKNFSGFQGIEVDIVYGNTIMPLVKVYGDPSNPIEYLPIMKNKKETEKLPVFGLIINKSNNHYAFYMNFLSIIHDKPEYLSIQMRTKQERQYVIDGQGYYSVEKTFKKFGIS